MSATPFTKSCQVLVRAEKQVLLYKWGSGDYKGRYTGLIREVDDKTIISNKLAQNMVEHFTGSYFGLRESEHCGGFQRNAILGFREAQPVSEALEHVFLVDLMKKPDGVEYYKDGGTLHWVNEDEIPYDEMPYDDQIWYPPFLDSKYVIGGFLFNGLDLEAHVLHTLVPKRKDSMSTATYEKKALGSLSYLRKAQFHIELRQHLHETKHLFKGNSDLSHTEEFLEPPTLPKLGSSWMLHSN